MKLLRMPLAIGVCSSPKNLFCSLILRSCPVVICFSTVGIPLTAVFKTLDWAPLFVRAIVSPAGTRILQGLTDTCKMCKLRNDSNRC